MVNAASLDEHGSGETHDNVIIIRAGYDYEKMIVKGSDHGSIIKAINDANGDDNYYENHKDNYKNPKIKRIKTNQPRCSQCGQEIWESVPEALIDGFDQEEHCLYRCLISDKAKYARPVAEQISQDKDPLRAIPTEIRELLAVLERDLMHSRGGTNDGSDGETTTDS